MSEAPDDGGAQGAGQDVLVVDGDPSVQRGLEQLLQAANLHPTVVGDPVRALELARDRFFSVALVDLDTPTAGAGVGLIAELNRRSPATTVLMMAARRNFDVAVAAFRAGAEDVIVKAPDQVEFLRERVVEAAELHRMEADRSRVIEETLKLHEDLMKVLLDTYRVTRELSDPGEAPLPGEQTAVLIVDDDYELQNQLAAVLASKGAYTLRSASSGGEAMDIGSRERFQIALIKEGLPDLPGSMVVRTVKGQAPETVVLLYRAPDGDTPGRVDVMEGSVAIPFIAEFRNPTQILERLDELRDASVAATRQRRHLAAFRQEHFDLLKRYAELRQRLENMIEEQTGAA